MSTRLKKTELIKALSAESGLSASDVAKVLSALPAVINAKLNEGFKVPVADLITISIKEVPERTVRNPADGSTRVKAAHKAPRIQIAKPLKDMVA